MSAAPQPADGRTGEASLPLDRYVEPFERAWQGGWRPALEDHLPATEGLRRAVLAELVHVELEYRLKAGEAARVEDYLGRYPELAQDRRLVLRLLAAEYDLRRRRQAPPSPGEYLERFPDHGRDLLFCARLPPGGSEGAPSRPACPHCSCPVNVPAEGAAEVTCPGCGSTFRVAGDADEPPGPPSRLGRFELLEVVGRGAFGVVYRARDTELGRLVAVKVPRAGTLTAPEEVDRFLREARSAAQLKHPGIVALYDAERVGGTCLLVSELVQGMSLADRLQAGPVPPTEAARLLAAVADALQYAHGQGVVHRDVKPSNILLDQEGAPHLADFGLARRDAGEATVTLEGQVLGTPAYMSPEQAAGAAHTADGRSDVYSLGVVLYQLLTGELPFRGTARMLLHQLLHEEPRPPRKLNDRIPRDLETICLKALAKEPGQRYPGAGDLADDLRRFLKGEPIKARSAGRRERLWRWCRRNPVVAGLTATTAAALVSAVAVLAVSTFLIARKQAETAAAYEAETRQRERMEANLRLALRAVHKMDTEVAEEWLAREPHKEDLRRQFLKQALEFYEEFSRENSTSPDVRREVGLAYHRMGDIYHTLGQHDEARQAFGRAIGLFQQLVDDFPGEPDYRHGLALGHHDLGVLLAREGDRLAAWEHYRAAFDLWTRLAADFPDEPAYREKLADSHRQQGHWMGEGGKSEEALAHYRKELDFRSRLAADFPGVPRYRHGLATNHISMVVVCGDDPAAAAGHFREAVSLCGRLVAEFPAHPDYRAGLAMGHYSLARLRDRPNDRPGAEEHLAEAIRLQSWLVEDFPVRPILRAVLASMVRDLGSLRLGAGDAAAADKEYRRSLDLLAGLMAEAPGVVDYRGEKARSHHQLGLLLRQQGRRAEAEGQFRQAIDLWSRLAADSPTVPAYRTELAGARTDLADLLQQTGW